MKHYFATHKSPIAVILLLVVVAGFFAYTHIQTSLFPEVTFPKIKIIAENGEQPAEKMMITVTRLIENAIKQVPELKTIRSTTSRGSCEISAFFNWGADINKCQQLLESRISQIRTKLPPATEITVEQMNPSILPVMGYALDAPGKNPIEQNMIASYIVKPFLSQVFGVSAIRIIGGKTKEYHVELDPAKMTLLGITPSMINDAVSKTNFITSNGFQSDYRRMYLSLTNATFNNVNDIEGCVIRNDGKRVVRIKDIASVVIRERTEYTRVNANGKEALLIGILKQPDANLIEVSDQVKTRIEELKNILPSGVSLKPFYVQADFVESAVKSVRDSLWIGLLLAIVVVVLFLRSFRASMTLLLTIPVTLALTLVTLYALGYTLNIMTLGAIAAAIGLLIDDAIVVTEQLFREHEENPGENSMILIGRSIKYLLPSMIGSSLSTIVIFIPFFLLSGVAGAYFSVLTNTMLITLLCSFLVTWLGLPVLFHFIFSNYNKFKELREYGNVHSHWVDWLIRKPFISVCLLVFLGIPAYIASSHLESGFLPEMDEGAIVLDYWSPPGTSLDETNKIMIEVEKIITRIPEVESYSRRTGTEMGFFITEPNKGDYLIQLKPGHKRSSEEVISDIRQRVEASQPALRIDMGQVIGDMLGDLMASVQPIEIKVFGDNKQKIEAIAKQATEVVGKVDGTADIFNGITISGPSLDIRPDFRQLARFGLSPADLQFQMQAQLEGNLIGSVQREQQTGIRMIYPNAVKSGFNELRSAGIFLPDGRLMPLSGLAKVRVVEGETEIGRENLQSMVAVTGRLEKRDLGSVMKEIQSKVSRQVPLPQGYHISYGGAYADQQRSFSELLMILLLAGSLVFILILFMFKDIKAAFLILFVSFFGVSGSLLALFLLKIPLNVGSYTGLIMIVGIIGENAIFTFQQFNTLRKEMDVPEAIASAVSIRFRPNLMTALCAIIALMPLALGIGTGSQLHQPLAVAVIGGFLVAVPLLIIVLPTLIRIVYQKR